MSAIEPNQMGKGEENYQTNDQDQMIDASIGLGGEDINWHNAPSLNSQQDVDSSIFDGQGNPTAPYSTDQRYMNRRKISMHAFFYTQKDEYDASWYVGRKDDPSLSKNENEYEFSQSLMGFDTDNQNKGIPTMQVYLFGLRDWEQILRMNDYCAVRVWEAYPDSPDEINGNSIDQANFPGDINGIRKRTLMVGLISDIQMNEDPNSSGRIYTITCQGMQKVLADINLGLPKTAQWNDVNLLYDINGASSPYNETFPTYSKGGSSVSSSKSSSSGGGGSFGLSGVPGQIASYFSGKGFTKVQVAAILGAVTVESNFQLQARNSSGATGLFQIIGHSYTQGSSSGSVTQQCEAICSFGSRVSSFKSATSSMSSPYNAASVWSSKVEIGGANYGDQAESWYHKMH